MSARPKLIERLLARREQHQTRHPLFRVAWGIAGALVLLGGVIMLVTPGPAFVLIPVGLAMLALEFEWAERLLERALVQAEKARGKAAAASTFQRVAGATLAAGTLAGAIVVAAVFVL
jgi:uncharacterized protein (TIGR02611 family)